MTLKQEMLDFLKRLHPNSPELTLMNMINYKVAESVTFKKIRLLEIRDPFLNL